MMCFVRFKEDTVRLGEFGDRFGNDSGETLRGCAH